MQMMVSLLRAMERDDALPLFEEALDSPQFYTRWHVMREMLGDGCRCGAAVSQADGERGPASRGPRRRRADARVVLREAETAPAGEGDAPCRA